MHNQELILDRYQLGELLGEGGMGSVFQARNIHTGNLVAIKFLNPGAVATDVDAVRRFEQEAQLLLELDHPNIVRVLTSAESPVSEPIKARPGHFPARHILVNAVPSSNLVSPINRRRSIVTPGAFRSRAC